MTKKDLCDLLEKILKDYREEGILDSIRRNASMNDYDPEDTDSIILATLIDFINYVGEWQGIDLGLHKHYLTDDSKKE